MTMERWKPPVQPSATVRRDLPSAFASAERMHAEQLMRMSVLDANEALQFSLSQNHGAASMTGQGRVVMQKGGGVKRRAAQHFIGPRFSPTSPGRTLRS